MSIGVCQRLSVSALVIRSKGAVSKVQRSNMVIEIITYSRLDRLESPRYLQITPASCPLCPHILDKQVESSVCTVSPWPDAT